ncbi:MAG: heme-binding protein [Nitrospirae bacterium]|nr:heme-binding protein [Nitrospirota bacterium]
MSCDRLIVCLSIVSGLGLFAGPARAEGLPVEKVLPLSLATEAAQTALAACEKEGYHVSVAVVDRVGLVRILIRGNGAGPHTLDSSRRKAYTSASLRRSTADLVKLIEGRPDDEGLSNMNDQILILAGGLPVKAGEDVIGGIGVGGAPGGEKDETCALAGLDKIRDRLK